jgi:hypothetical protein
VQREMIWNADDGIGSEYLILTADDTGILIDSVVFATRDAEPARVHYELRCDPGWCIRKVTIAVAQSGFDQ